MSVRRTTNSTRASSSWRRPNQKVAHSKRADELRAQGYGPALIRVARLGGGTVKIDGKTYVVKTSTSSHPNE